MSALLAEDVPTRVVAVSRRPRSLGARVPGTISLAMGEPDVPTATAVVDAAVCALRDGRTHYAPLAGSEPLRQAIAAFLSTTRGRAIGPEQVVPAHGGSAGLAAAILTLARPGDRVLIPEPTYSLYADQVAMAGAEVVWVPNRADGAVDLDLIRELAPGARLLILCNPANPTGAVVSPERLRALSEIVASHGGLHLLVDEAYSEIVFDGARFTSALAMTDAADRTVVVGTFSKTFAMTGWRLGYVVAPVNLAERIALVHRTFNGALNTFVQDAAVAALATPRTDLVKMCRTYQRRRDIVMDALTRIPRLTITRPAGAFYAFPKIECGLNSSELAARFASGGVLVRAGSEYGPSGEGHVRVSFATDEESLNEGLRRFAHVIATL